MAQDGAQGVGVCLQDLDERLLGSLVRKLQPEAGTLAWRRVHRERTAMSDGNAPREVQPQAEPLVTPT